MADEDSVFTGAIMKRLWILISLMCLLLAGGCAGGVGRRYGQGVPLMALAEAVARIDYPGLKAPRLYLLPLDAAASTFSTNRAA